MLLPPNLPEDPILAADDSMLTRRLGREVINYFSGSHLNRYSFLRSDPLFLRTAIGTPATRFIVLKSLNPLIADAQNLAFFGFDDVKGLTGPDPFGDEYDVKLYDSTRRRGPLVVFLGLVLQPAAEELAVDIATEKHGVVRGQPYFAVDATPSPDSHGERAEEFLKSAEAKGPLVQSNARSMTLNPKDDPAAMYAQARSLMDWNARNAFCAACGRPTIPSEAGYKRLCPPVDCASAPPAPLPDCPTRHGISNISFPRTDPTMIAAVVSADGARLLLGRQARWPPRWYSALAGFLEPGESIEDAVRREVWEESGVRVGRVAIHSSQPWPFPASLMIGAIAQALPGGEDIELNDKELEDAKWFTIAEVREALDRGGLALDEAEKGAGGVAGHLRLPPPQAIANRLVRAVVDGFLSAAPKI
ncbi:Peroxisomal NADH pyrophosphatase NUDT12 [Escovopsis weberi]|uniref:NAD(+) diphosphatase n=1 Tax=Escovopsis weberi TaxID=150374 RepID=A0A0M8N229_ESCWE|nr:Peroxisomal NADH pyrophosphatase NUDT12 [Escovopsis weberi]